MAPKPHELKEDIVQIYYARAFSWRGYFGIHPWIAWKKKEEQQYTVAQVTSWNIRRLGTTIDMKEDIPDRLWFDSTPSVLYEARGKRATSIIKQLKPLILNYPYKDKYRVYPGPNSNTFVTYLIRNIDELDIELPSTAIGKGYLGDQFLVKTASKTGATFSLFGLLGVTLGAMEGLEVNIFGLHFGIDLWTPALSFPIIGRIGFPDSGQ